MTRSLARRFGAGILASASGLFVGSAAAGVVGLIVLVAGWSFEYRYRSLQALVVDALQIVAEGMFWSLLGGAMFVAPLALVALAAFQPRNTPATAIFLSLVLLVPLFVGYFPGRTINVVFLAVPVWLGVRVALGLYARMAPA